MPDTPSHHTRVGGVFYMTKKKVDPREPMKREIARELGLEDIIDRDGWGALTSAQAGKIGGLMARRFPGKGK